MNDGIIVGVKCGIYNVLKDGVLYHVPARGLFRKTLIKPAVGDKVSLSEDYLMISSIEERKSVLKRPYIANIDQMLLVFSLREPDFSYHLAFKYLTYANMSNITAKLVLTKEDMLSDKNEISEITRIFNSIGVEVYVISSKTKVGLEQIKSLFKDKISVLVGQSGVGKSSLLNAIDNDYQRSIGEYSKALGRGKHETKETILLPYEGGFIADTPGFSSLDLELFKEDLAIYFPYFNKKYTECYFSNCLHISEKRCVIKDDVEKGIIPKIAYESYLKLSEEAIYKAKRGY